MYLLDYTLRYRITNPFYQGSRKVGRVRGKGNSHRWTDMEVGFSNIDSSEKEWLEIQGTHWASGPHRDLCPSSLFPPMASFAELCLSVPWTWKSSNPQASEELTTPTSELQALSEPHHGEAHCWIQME